MTRRSACTAEALAGSIECSKVLFMVGGTMSHLLSCKLRKRELYNFQIWNGGEDGLFIRRDDSQDTEEDFPDIKFVGQFLSTDDLSAHITAFGELPQLDSRIFRLVLAINDVPGIMTKFSCMGHRERRDTSGYLMFTAQNHKDLREFGRWLTLIQLPSVYQPWDDNYPEGIAPDADPELPMEIDLEYVLNGTNDQGDELRMSLRFSRPNRALPPSEAAYNWLAAQIRGQLAAHGCTCPPQRASRFSGEHRVRESRPTRRGALRYKPAKEFPRIPSALAQSAWTSRSLLAVSSVVRRAEGRLAYRLAVSVSGSKPSDDVCRDVLQDFGMQGAEERTVRGAEHARHFELSLDAKAFRLTAS